MTACSSEVDTRVSEGVSVKSNGVYSGNSGLVLAQRYLSEILDSKALQLNAVVCYIIENAGVSLGSVLYALKYVERYLSSGVAVRNTTEPLKTDPVGNPPNSGGESALTPLEMVVSAFVLANKFLEDSYYSNKFWSETLSIPLPVINSVELRFLAAISFRLHITDTEFSEWCASLEKLLHSDIKKSETHSTLKRCKIVRTPAQSVPSQQIKPISHEIGPMNALSSSPRCAACRFRYKICYPSKHSGYPVTVSTETNRRVCSQQPHCGYAVARVLGAQDPFLKARMYDQQKVIPARRRPVSERRNNTLLEHKHYYYNPTAFMPPYRLPLPTHGAVVHHTSIPPRLNSSSVLVSGIGPLCVNPIS